MFCILYERPSKRQQLQRLFLTDGHHLAVVQKVPSFCHVTILETSRFFGTSEESQHVDTKNSTLFHLKKKKNTLVIYTLYLQHSKKNPIHGVG